MGITQLGIGLESHDDLRAGGPVEWVVGLELGQLVGDRQEQAVHAVIPRVGNFGQPSGAVRQNGLDLANLTVAHLHEVVVGLPAADRPLQVIIVDAAFCPELFGLFKSFGRYLLAAGAAGERPNIARMPAIAKLRNQDPCCGRFIEKGSLILGSPCIRGMGRAGVAVMVPGCQERGRLTSAHRAKVGVDRDLSVLRFRVR